MTRPRTPRPRNLSPPSEYRINRVKPISPMKRYEYWYTHGIMVDGVMLVGRALDDYTDLQIWLEAHPGQDPVQRILLGGNDA